jgi:tetratricopeptide (TPR) repeat protein
LEKVIAMEPDRDHLPYLNLAECCVILKRYDRAIWAYQEVLRIRPKAMNMWDEIALIWEKMGKSTEAVNYYLKQIKEYQKKIGMLRGAVAYKVFVKPNGKQEDRERLLKYYVKLAEAYWKQDMLTEAEKWFKNVERVYYKFGEPCNIINVESAPCNVTNIETVAEFYRDTGRAKEAERVMKRLFDYMKKNNISRYHTYFTMVTIMFERGDKERAEKCADLYLESFLKQHGGEENLLADRRYRPMYLYNLAIMNICAGRLDKAKVYLQQLGQSHLCVTCETSGCFEYHFGLGLIAELEGRKEEAKKHYQKAIEIKGNYPCCKKHLEML